MLIVFVPKKPAILSAFTLFCTFLFASEAVTATDFDPFGPDEPVMQSLQKSVTDEGPLIPQVEFSDNDISMVLQIISDATGWSIFPTTEVSKAKISLWAKSITAKELLETVVTMAGFIYHRDRDVITVMTYDEYMQYYGLGKKVISLKYADAGSVADVIKPFLTRLGKSVVHKETNVILLFESEANLKTIEGIVEKLDIPGEAKVFFEVIDLKYADAVVLADILKKVLLEKTLNSNQKNKLEEKEASSNSDKQTSEIPNKNLDVLVTPQSYVEVYSIDRANQIIVKASHNDIEKVKELVEKLDTYTEPTSKNYHFTYVDAAEIYTGLELILNISGRYGTSQKSKISGRENGDRYEGIILIEKTNSILLTGPPSMHRIMTSIVDTTDKPGKYEGGLIKVYKLENADVEEVAKTLQELLKSDEEQKKKSAEVKYSKDRTITDSETTDSGDMTETEEFVPQIEARVSVNKSTNSVVVQATARQHRQLEKLIAELDVRRKQVLIKAIIVEVATNDDLDLGVELAHVSGDILAFTSFGLSAINPDNGSRDIIVSPGGTAAVLEPDKVQIIIRALKSDGNVRVMSVPQILANDNALGFINSIAEEPVTQVNASDTVATTSFAGFVEAGTQFAITPHISETECLRIEYQITLNSFSGESTEPSIPPPRNTSSIRSEATVPDKHTIVIGGLQRTDEIEVIDKVPLLGDVPILGLAFRNTTIRKQYRTSYLFITPTIIKSEDFTDLKDVSKEALEEMKLDGNNNTTHSQKPEGVK